MKHIKQSIEWHRSCIRNMRITINEYLAEMDKIYDKIDRLGKEIAIEEAAIETAVKKGKKEF